MNENGIILCKKCNHYMVKLRKKYSCIKCGNDYPIKNKIIFIQKDNNKNLRMSKDILNYYQAIKERKFYGEKIESTVDYIASVHSLQFSKKHVEILSPFLNNSRMLDIGCGQLPYINLLRKEQVRAFYGVDLHTRSLEIAKNNFSQKFPLILLRNDFENIPLNSNSFDAIISSEVIEHLDNPKRYLRELYRLCKQKGYLSISTPSSSMYLYPFNFLLLCKHPKSFSKWKKKVNAHMYWEESLKWHPGIRPKVFRSWVETSGFEVMKHLSTLWYYHTPVKPVWRLMKFLENRGFERSGIVFKKYLTFTEQLLSLNIPVVKWFGIRQFILCRKR